MKRRARYRSSYSGQIKGEEIVIVRCANLTRYIVVISGLMNIRLLVPTAVYRI